MKSIATGQSVFTAWYGRHLWHQPSADMEAANSFRIEHFQAAFHHAYQWLKQTYPTWINHRFDDALLRPWLAHYTYSCHSATKRSMPTPSAVALAQQWDRQFGPLYTAAERVHLLSVLTSVAAQFLARLEQELAR